MRKSGKHHPTSAHRVAGKLDRLRDPCKYCQDRIANEYGEMTYCKCWHRTRDAARVRCKVEGGPRWYDGYANGTLYYQIHPLVSWSLPGKRLNRKRRINLKRRERTNY